MPIESPSNEEFVVIGKVISSVPEYPAKLFKSSLFRHILVAGTTGSGKSYTASLIAERVVGVLKIPTVILDWHGEYSDLLSDYSAIDPYSTPLQLFTNDPKDLAVISSVLELTPPQEYLLEKITKRMELSKLKTIETFLDYLESVPDESSWMRESKLALHRKLSLLARENYSSLFKLYDPLRSTIHELRCDLPCVIDLGKISDVGVRRLYAAFLVKRLVDSFIQAKRPVLMIIEEAQNYLLRNQAIRPICEMLREVRKFNIGFIVISQSIQQLAEDAITNTNTKIIHAVKSKSDLELIEKSLYIDQSLLSTLPYIDPGEAVYSTPTLKKAMLIKVE